MSKLSLIEIREIRLRVIAGKVPKARDVIELCERLEDQDKDGAKLREMLEDAGYSVSACAKEETDE